MLLSRRRLLFVIAKTATAVNKSWALRARRFDAFSVRCSTHRRSHCNTFNSLLNVANAKIEAELLRDHPVHVDILFQGQTLWTAPQRDLFRKYPDKRQKSQDAIAAVLRAIDPDNAADE